MEVYIEMLDKTLEILFIYLYHLPPFHFAYFMICTIHHGHVNSYRHVMRMCSKFFWLWWGFIMKIMWRLFLVWRTTCRSVQQSLMGIVGSRWKEEWKYKWETEDVVYKLENFPLWVCSFPKVCGLISILCLCEYLKSLPFFLAIQPCVHNTWPS